MSKEFECQASDTAKGTGSAASPFQSIDTPEAIIKEIGRVAGWAPGNYFGKCCDCKREFIGDKRALQCLPCAIKSLKVAAERWHFDGEEVGLLPCPFCGPGNSKVSLWRDDVGSGHWQVNCGRCGGSSGNLPANKHFPNARQRIIDGWNTRNGVLRPIEEEPVGDDEPDQQAHTPA